MRIWRHELRDDQGRVMRKATAAISDTAPMAARRMMRRVGVGEEGTGSPDAAGSVDAAAHPRKVGVSLC